MDSKSGTRASKEAARDSSQQEILPATTPSKHQEPAKTYEDQFGIVFDNHHEPANTYEDQSGTGQRKRRRDSEEENTLPLTRENLRKHRRQMGSTTDTSDRGRGKRRSRGHSMTASARNDEELAEDPPITSQVTQKPSPTAPHYRLGPVPLRYCTTAMTLPATPIQGATPRGSLRQEKKVPAST